MTAIRQSANVAIKSRVAVFFAKKTLSNLTYSVFFMSYITSTFLI